MSKKHVIVDIDGTLTIRGGRDPYDMTKVLDDEPNKAIIKLVLDLFELNYGIIIVTGRDYSAEKDTKAWILEHMGLNEEEDYYLYMRGGDDNRPDDQIKQTIYDEMINGCFEQIMFVLDDRDQTVKMWRDNGLTCLQVNYGNF